jgi:hypothetical protein
MTKTTKFNKLTEKMMLRIILLILLLTYSINVQSQTYTDVAISQTILHTLNSSDASGSSVSFFDINNDGWDDLTFAKEDDTIFYYLNNAGNYQKYSTGIFNMGQTKHLLWADYDNDADYDLMISTYVGAYRLFQNTGNLNFQEVTIQAGFSGLDARNFGCSFADFDIDGDLDLYICRYADPGGTDTTDLNLINAFYVNNGNGTFTNMSLQTGIGNDIKRSFQGIWIDYNRDNLPDLYVINDKDNLNTLYHNNGNGAFTDITLASGTEDFDADPMTATAGDFDNDGDYDIYMTNTGIGKKCRILVNNNDGTFTMQAQQLSLDLDELSWGATWLDYDNDAFLDLYVTTVNNGSIVPPGTEIRNVFYVNNNGTSFVDSPQLFLDNHLAASFNVAAGDINNDGYADIAVQNIYGLNAFLWQSSGGANHYIKTTLQGVISNHMAIGSWIDVHAGGNKYVYYTQCGENYLSQNSQHHIFGLGQNTTVDSVIVTYLSGIIDKYYNLPVDSHYYFKEGETYQNNIVYNSNLSFCEGDSIVLDAGAYSSYLWSNGYNQRYLTVTNSGNYWVDVTNSNGLSIPSDSITIFVADLPQINFTTNNITCYGENDGTVMLNLVNQTLNYSVQWNNSIYGDSLSALPEGTYTYEYTDTFGCYLIDSVFIIEPFDYNVQTQTIAYTDSTLGSIQSIINGGTPPYLIYFNGIVVGNLIDSLQPGQYLFEVYDANWCYHLENFTIADLSTIGIQEKPMSLKVFPNPITNNEITLLSDAQIVSINIYSIHGQEMEFIKLNNKIYLPNNYKGILFLEFKTTDEVYRIKMLKN